MKFKKRVEDYERYEGGDEAWPTEKCPVVEFDPTAHKLCKEDDNKDDFKKDPDDFTYVGGLWMITKVSIFPIIGMLFHPSYILVNTKLLGSFKPDAATVCLAGDTTLKCVDSATYVAAFGLASSTMGIIFLAPGLCFAIGLTNIMP